MSFDGPALLAGATRLPFMVLPNYRAWVVVASLCACALTWFVIERTRVGALLRAGTENARLVETFGVNVPLMVTLTYAFGAALAAFPWLTVGFYSKDPILWETYASHHEWLLACGWIGAFMTSLYTLRLILVTFHGPAQIQAHGGHGVAYGLPLVLLLVLSTGVGALIHPPLQDVLPASVGHAGGDIVGVFQHRGMAFGLDACLFGEETVRFRRPGRLVLQSVSELAVGFHIPHAVAGAHRAVCPM